jgi:hypothetical protein
MLTNVTGSELIFDDIADVANSAISLTCSLFTFIGMNPPIGTGLLLDRVELPGISRLLVGTESSATIAGKNGSIGRGSFKVISPSMMTDGDLVLIGKQFELLRMRVFVQG